MRKEVRFGLVVGAILLAVLVVYVLVVPSPNDTTEVTLDTVDNAIHTNIQVEDLTDAVDVSPQQPVEDAGTAPSFVPQREVEPVRTQTPPDLMASNEVDWGAILQTGSLAATEVRRTARPEVVQPAPAIRSHVEDPVIVAMQNQVQTPEAHTGEVHVGEVAAVPSFAVRQDNTQTPRLSGERKYIIQAGDHFPKIAQKIHGDSRYFSQIQQANPGIDPTRLRPGQEINLPSIDTAAPAAAPASAAREPAAIDATRQYRVQSGDSLHKIAHKLYGDANAWEQIYNANKQLIGPDPAKVKIGQVLELPTALSQARQ